MKKLPRVPAAKRAPRAKPLPAHWKRTLRIMTHTNLWTDCMAHVSAGRLCHLTRRTVKGAKQGTPLPPTGGTPPIYEPELYIYIYIYLLLFCIFICLISCVLWVGGICVHIVVLVMYR